MNDRINDRDPFPPDTALESNPAEPTVAIATATAIIFFGSLASRILGLVREQLAAREFGAGNDIAAFTVADNLNTLIYDLLASGLTQSALVPVLAVMVVSVAATRSELRKSTGALLGLGLLVSGVLTVLGMLFAPQLVGLMTNLAGNGAARGTQITELAVESLRIVLPSLVFLTAATILTASLYALEKPIGPSLGFTARNAVIVISILLLGDRLGVRSMAVGVVVGAVLLTLVQLVSLQRQHALPELSLDFRNPAVSRVLRLYVPVFLGLIVSSGVVILDRNLAWSAEQDAVGAMRFATALVQLILGLVAAAVSLAALPGLSRAHSRNDEVGLCSPAFERLDVRIAIDHSSGSRHGRAFGADRRSPIRTGINRSRCRASDRDCAPDLLAGTLVGRLRPSPDFRLLRPTEHDFASHDWYHRVVQLFHRCTLARVAIRDGRPGRGKLDSIDHSHHSDALRRPTNVWHASFC